MPKLVIQMDRTICLAFALLALSTSPAWSQNHDKTKASEIMLETTHVLNVFLKGQPVSFTARAIGREYHRLNLSYEIERRVAGDNVDVEKKGTIVIDFEKDSAQTVEVGTLPPGTYAVRYSFSKSGDVLSRNHFNMSVIKDTTLSRKEQLQLLQKKCIIVPMWGWPYEQMCSAAKKVGYNVFMPPRFTAKEISYYLKHGLECIIRPAIYVNDPFDSADVDSGCRKLKKVVEFYGSDPKVLGFSIMWGLYGEGGFKVPPYGDFGFSAQARREFNSWMNTPGEPLPVADSSGLPSDMRYIKWIEFRQRVLTNFRKEYISAAKQVTRKLVGTWSEVYPVSLYTLNMGDAPGADFMCYDLSFGDVTFNQRIAFAETHGDMQQYPDFESWKEHILPLVAKAYGEGVTPMGFQFPMRRGHAVNFLSKTKYFVDRIQDDYELRISPEFRKLMSNKVIFHAPQVALIYQSYGASAFPQKPSSFALYDRDSREIEALLHMMGAYMQALPLEKLSTADLNKYKLIIIPDAMYLTEKMYKNIMNTSAKILVTGDFLRAYWDGKNYVHATKWGECKRFGDFEIEYGKVEHGSIKIDSRCDLTRHLEKYDDMPYCNDRFAVYKKFPPGARVLISCNETPLLIQFDNGKMLHITNRLFGHARTEHEDSLEHFAFRLLKNILKHSGVAVNISNPPFCRAGGYAYAPYGLSNNILWNQTNQNLDLLLPQGKNVIVPKHYWKNIDTR